MTKRTLTIAVQPDWRGALRAAAQAAQAAGYQGETLSFETASTLFDRLTAPRWMLLETLVAAGELPVPELARRAGRDVRRVHDDVAIFAELGLVERTARGGVVCPYADIHIDMRLQRTADAA